MAKRLLLLVVSLSVVILVFEVALARLAPQRTVAFELAANPAIYQKGDPLPYSLAPGTRGRLLRDEFDTQVIINAHGYRDDDFALEKPEGTERILVLGDSFTFGWGVESDETYSQQLEKILAGNHPGRSIEVINAGFASGPFPGTYYLYLREKGLELDPDLIVVGLFMGNDIDHERAGEFPFAEVDEDGLPRRFEQKFTFKDGHFVMKYPRFRWRYPVLRDSEVFQLGAESVRTIRKKFEDPGEQWIREGYMYVDPYPPRTEKRVALIEKLLLGTYRLAKDRGVPILFVMIPTIEQVYVGHGTVREDFDLEKPQRILSEFFEREGIPYLDLLPALRESASDEDLYFWSDQHWNVAGNALAARLLVGPVEESLEAQTEGSPDHGGEAVP